MDWLVTIPCLSEMTSFIGQILIMLTAFYDNLKWTLQLSLMEPILKMIFSSHNNRADYTAANGWIGNQGRHWKAEMARTWEEQNGTMETNKYIHYALIYKQYKGMPQDSSIHDLNAHMSFISGDLGNNHTLDQSKYEKMGLDFSTSNRGSTSIQGCSFTMWQCCSSKFWIVKCVWKPC